MDDVIWADTRALDIHKNESARRAQTQAGARTHLRSSMGVNNGVPLNTGNTVRVTTLQGELG